VLLNKLNNLILVTGNAPSVGKTEMVCAILREFCPTYRIYSARICLLTAQSFDRDSRIEKVLDMNANSDAARMLEAGALACYAINSSKKNLKESFHSFLSRVENDSILVIESDHSIPEIIPGLHLFVMDTNSNSEDDIVHDSSVYPLTRKEIDDSVARLSIDFRGWKFQETR
jgi:hypothetical protein